jgi:hypothetical protein
MNREIVARLHSVVYNLPRADAATTSKTPDGAPRSTSTASSKCAELIENQIAPHGGMEKDMFGNNLKSIISRGFTLPERIDIGAILIVALLSGAAQLVFVTVATTIGIPEYFAMLLSGCLIYGIAISYVAKRKEQGCSFSERSAILNVSGVWFFIGMVQFFGFRPFFGETNGQTIFGFLGLLTLHVASLNLINRRLEQ